MNFRPFVYIASPYTKGDPSINTNFQMRIFDRMLDDGIVVPYAPLWSHFQHSAFPRPYKDWIEYDNVIIPKVDALVRLTAEHEKTDYKEDRSSGADREVALAESLGIPVFYSIEALYAWALQVGPRGPVASGPPPVVRGNS